MDRARVDEIARTHGIELLVQFGSSVSGLTHAESDVDLAVLFKRAPESLGEHADLVADLQTLIPGRDVDVATLNRADPLFLKQVSECGTLQYGSPRRWQEFRLYCFRRYQDHRRFLQMEREYVDRAIARRQ